MNVYAQILTSFQCILCSVLGTIPQFRRQHNFHIFLARTGPLFPVLVGRKKIFSLESPAVLQFVCKTSCCSHCRRISELAEALPQLPFVVLLFIRPRTKQSPTQTLYYTTEIQLKGREKRTYALEIAMQMPFPCTALAVSQDDMEAGSQVSG